MTDFLTNEKDECLGIVQISKIFSRFLGIDSYEEIEKLFSIEVENMGFISPNSIYKIRDVVCEMDEKLVVIISEHAKDLNADLVEKILDGSAFSPTLRKKFKTKLKVIFRELQSIYDVSPSYELEPIDFKKLFDSRVLKEKALCFLTGVSIITPREEIHVAPKNDDLDFHWAIMLQVYKKIFGLESFADDWKGLESELEEAILGGEKNFIRIRHVVNPESVRMLIWLPMYITPFQKDTLLRLHEITKIFRPVVHVELTSFNPILGCEEEHVDALTMRSIVSATNYLTDNKRVVDYDLDIPASYYGEEKKPSM